MRTGRRCELGLIPYAGNDALVNLAAAGLVGVVPIGAGLAVTRYHLYEVDHILSRAVTYLIVTGLVVGTYVAVVFVVARTAGQAAVRSPAATTVATLVAAACRLLTIASLVLMSRSCPGAGREHRPRTRRQPRDVPTRR